eukprot:TRINITY_DN3333_c0_g1_i2.p1 TRINITY_DN3333_c0_g1~~TRINITY_DN3333_c0_g1_i2.p1  ORF type:complete len:503 (+),score=74.89 TRINITY_DN3333_c0_g1_i2:75-1583(+)
MWFCCRTNAPIVEKQDDAEAPFVHELVVPRLCRCSEDTGVKKTCSEDVAADRRTKVVDKFRSQSQISSVAIDEYYDLCDPKLSDGDDLSMRKVESRLVHKHHRVDGEISEIVKNQGFVTAWAGMATKVLHHTVMSFQLLYELTDVEKTKKTLAARESSSSMRIPSFSKRRAESVWNLAKSLITRVGEEEVDVLDNDWQETGLLQSLFGSEYIDTLIILCKAALKAVSVQPALVEADLPCRVFGDIHGQFRDLLMLFKVFGAPGAEDIHFVFNGDWVDRGRHQIEVVGVLFALKILYPDKVWLVRGNHEERSMNKKYGFLNELATRCGQAPSDRLFNAFHSVFDQLPLACLIAQSVLVVHGGIGDGTWSLNQLRAAKRPFTLDTLLSNQWLYNIMWSDPIEDDDQSLVNSFGVHESPRGELSIRFAWDVTKFFLTKNYLSLVIRSHQAKKHGNGFQVMHENRLISVFSARDYCGNGNDGAVLLLTEDDGVLKVKPQVLRSLNK